MPRGGKVDRTHMHIMRRLKGSNRSQRAYAIMVGRGMVKRRGKHLVMTPRFRKGHALKRYH